MVDNTLAPHPAGLTGAMIRLANLTKPLSSNARTRYCHYHNVIAPRRSDRDYGWGGYLASPTPPENRCVKFVRMDSKSCVFNLRIEYANDSLPSYSQLRGINGYYADNYQDSTIVPYIVRLNHNRGFLAACGEGPGMWFSLDAGIHDSAEDAARAAHNLAERTAERECEYRAKEAAEQAAEQAAKDRRQEFLDSVDTCLSCYLQDHHNRPGELLLGVAVDGASTYAAVEESLLAEFESAMWDYDIPAEIADDLDKAVRATIIKKFSHVRDKTVALFDSSLDSPPSDDPDSDEYDSAVDIAPSTDDPDELRAEACRDAQREWENREMCYAWFLITYDVSLMGEES